MLKINFLKIICLFALCFFLSTSSYAEFETQKTFDHYTVHFSVFTSTSIPAEIASLHDITRGKDIALVNITVIDNDKDNAFGQSATVTGTATNLLQQQKSLSFKEIKEPGTTYYIASMRFINEEIFHFNIEVDPPGSDGPYQLKFSKTLYVNP